MVQLFDGSRHKARAAFPRASIIRQCVEGQVAPVLVFDTPEDAIGHPTTRVAKVAA